MPIPKPKHIRSLLGSLGEAKTTLWELFDRAESIDPRWTRDDTVEIRGMFYRVCMLMDMVIAWDYKENPPKPP